jgi:hypothetical protein
MKTDINFWSYLTQFFWEWEILQTEFVKKLQTNFVFRKFFISIRK